jgi:hypothetical protein
MPCGGCCRAHLCFSQKVGVPQTAFGPDGRVKRQSSEATRSNCPASSSGSTPGLCPQVHLFSHVPSCFSLLKGGALSSRLRFVVKNRCQDIHNCQHLDGRADCQTHLCLSRPPVACLYSTRLRDAYRVNIGKSQKPENLSKVSSR